MSDESKYIIYSSDETSRDNTFSLINNLDDVDDNIMTKLFIDDMKKHLLKMSNGGFEIIKQSDEMDFYFCKGGVSNG